MTRKQRIKNILIGILMIICAVVIIEMPETGLYLIVIMVCISCIIGGFRDIVYFITMARHMVGGRVVLYKGIIMLDIGAFALTLQNVPEIGVMIYLIIGLIFAGAIDIIRALESKRLKAQSWKMNFSEGIVIMAMAILCITYIRSTEMLVWVYGICLVYSAIVRIVHACRKTAIVYIQ